LPGSLIVRARRAEPVWFGALTDGFEIDSPAHEEVADSSKYEGLSTASYCFGIAARLLGDWIGSDATLSSGGGKEHRISFEIRGVRVVTMAPALLSNALFSADPRPAVIALDQVRLYAITEVIQARKIVMFADRSTKARGYLDLKPGPGHAAKFEIDGSKAAQGVCALTFRQHHTIGFKAHELELFDGSYRLVLAPSAGLTHANAPGASHEPVVFDDSNVM
jgi:hypothetical protein